MVDAKLTQYLADLSKIEFNADELEQMTADMSGIIALMDKVCGFDKESRTYALDAVEYDDLRNDSAEESYPTDKIVKNAKNVKNDSFVVPKVV